MRLREIRRAKNITQQQLGEVIGVNNSIISKYEKGLVVPPADKLARMAEFLQISVEDLIETPNVEKNPVRENTPDIKEEFIKTNHKIAGNVDDVDFSNVEYCTLGERFFEDHSKQLKESAWSKVDLKVLVAVLSMASPPISQAKLAKQLNISPVTLSRIVTSNDCSVREEWIPVLTEHLLSVDFPTISSSVDALREISTRTKTARELNDATMFLQNVFSSCKATYMFDKSYWGIPNGIIRFFDTVANRQWLFILGKEFDYKSWRSSTSGLGPFSKFLRLQSMLSSNDKVSVLYFDPTSFNQSVKTSSYPRDIRVKNHFRLDQKLPCFQSLILGNLENQSIEAEYALTDFEGEPLE